MHPAEIKNKRILLSPLNWGMGHVARCIPLIDQLVKNGNIVFVACTDEQEWIFRQYFPSIEYISHAGYPFKFGKHGNFGLDLFKQFIPLKERLKAELLEVEEMVKRNQIDLVISDHRYGFRSDNVPSVILTHQLNLPVRWYEGLVQMTHHKYMKAFDEIWIPDTEKSDYAGTLSTNSSGFKVIYLGSLSRFSLYDKPLEKDLECVHILSGPTIYAKIFLEEKIKNSNLSAQHMVIASKEIADQIPENLCQLQFSEDWRACDELILRANKIISRSGYSTLMDLVELKTPFAITPTPRQREQEYLFDLWYKKSLHNSGSLIQNKE